MPRDELAEALGRAYHHEDKALTVIASKLRRARDAGLNGRAVDCRLRLLSARPAQGTWVDHLRPWRCRDMRTRARRRRLERAGQRLGRRSHWCAGRSCREGRHVGRGEAKRGSAISRARAGRATDACLRSGAAREGRTGPRNWLLSRRSARRATAADGGPSPPAAGRALRGPRAVPPALADSSGAYPSPETE